MAQRKKIINSKSKSFFAIHCRPSDAGMTLMKMFLYSNRFAYNLSMNYIAPEELLRFDVAYLDR
jgi:hypothetical protein